MRWILAAALTVAVACATGDRGSSSWIRSDSAAVQIIVNHAISGEGGAEWLLDSVPITVVGRNTADTNQQFRRIPAAARLPNGGIATSENGNVNVFDSAGTHIRTLARRGSGPGEFTSITRMIVMRDTLFVRGNGKVARYSLQDGGTYVSEEQYGCADPPEIRRKASWCFDFYGDGTAVFVAQDSTIPTSDTNRPSRLMSNGFTSPGPGLFRPLMRVFLIPPSRDTIFSTGYSAGIEQFGFSTGPESNLFVIHPFYSRRAYHAYGGTPGRLAIALNPEYNIEIWNERGTLERIIRKTNGRRVPTDSDRVEARKSIEMQLDGDPRITIERALAEMSVPDSLPAITGLLVGPSGEVVVRRSTSAGDIYSWYDVFDDRGVWVAEWKLPARSYIAEVGEYYVLSTRSNEDDLPIVEVRMRRRGSNGQQ